MKLYRNGFYTGFHREEFACRCGCGFDTVDTELLDVLIDIKERFNFAPVIINSGCRCEIHNKAVGGAIASTHLKGVAVDAVVVGVDASDVFSYLDGKYEDKYGIGKYLNRTHIDVRQNKARWEVK